MYDKKTIDSYNKNALSYAILTDNQPIPALEDFIRKMPRNSHVLDLGCGTGVASARMKEQMLKVDSIDASQKMVEITNKRHGLSARRLSFSDITGRKIYKGVWANFSLLHVAKNKLHHNLINIHQLLTDCGIFSIGMKLGSGERRDRLNRHYSYYTKSELLELSRKVGFLCEKEYFGEAAGLEGEIEPWIILFLKKQIST